MTNEVEKLFEELVELSPEARAQYFASHDVDHAVRRDVEGLLHFDSGASAFLQHNVGAAANRALVQLDSFTGRQCGPYHLVELLGSGGMGAVYLAERTDGEVAQRVAVKVLPMYAGDPQRVRFLQERQILAMLAHPNIARMLDAGHADNSQPYLVMEYVNGRPINEVAAGLSVRDKIALCLQACAAVAYLHRNLIVHRDLKPGNVLVTPDGELKLLDFGIAKILDVTADSASTSIRMLTFDYASPEQFTGGRVSTATDIYSLGALLYHLLTGKPAREFADPSAESMARAVVEREVTRPSRWAPELSGDVEAILLKALRNDPLERYATVEQFADDLQAFLESRPVRARSGNAVYRTRKFLRRHWVPFGAVALVTVGLAAGLYVANRERRTAQQRFTQVRHLANRVLALDTVIAGLPGATKARYEIVAVSKEYLESLAADARGDPDLALEMGIAYQLLARVQGVPTASNLGLYADAAESLRRADDLLGDVLAAAPRNRQALLASADVAQSRVILADANRQRDELLTQSAKAVQRLDLLLDLGTVSEAEGERASAVFCNLAVAHKNLHRPAEAARLARRAIEISRNAGSRRVYAQATTILADSLRLSGNLDGALDIIRESLSIAETAPYDSEVARRFALSSAYWREGVILAQEGLISPGREDEAALAFEKALDAADALAANDPNDSSSRFLLAGASRELGEALRVRDAPRALSVYDHALARLDEVANNAKARRAEAEILAGSSYALRRLNRTRDAQERIDAAFRRLQVVKDYPADRIDLGSEADTVLRALGDHLADTGQTRRAAEVYRELLEKALAAAPHPSDDLRDAAKLSGIYETLAGLDRQNGQIDRAEAMSRRRLELWQHWDENLASNRYILTQVKAARDAVARETSALSPERFPARTK